MKITKFGHSCLLVEEGEARIMIDPGKWNEGHTEVENLDAIFITHKHGDHADPASINTILAKNPGTPIYSNDHVTEELAGQNIVVKKFVGGDSLDVKGLSVEGYGEDHATILDVYPRTDNTCFLVGGRLFHPGDSLFVPKKQVEILALPIIAPWMKLADAINYAKKIKPKTAFSIHAGMLKEDGWLDSHGAKNMEEGTEWKVLETGVAQEF